MAIADPPLYLDEAERFIDRFLTEYRTAGVNPAEAPTGGLWLVGFVQGLQAAGVAVGDPYDPTLAEFLARQLQKFAAY